MSETISWTERRELTEALRDVKPHVEGGEAALDALLATIDKAIDVINAFATAEDRATLLAQSYRVVLKDCLR